MLIQGAIRDGRDAMSDGRDGSLAVSGVYLSSSATEAQDWHLNQVRN